MNSTDNTSPIYSGNELVEILADETGTYPEFVIGTGLLELSDVRTYSHLDMLALVDEVNRDAEAAA